MTMTIMMEMMMMTMMVMKAVMMTVMIIMAYQRGWDTCVPTPKRAYFSVFKAFLFLKYLKNNLGLIFDSFNPLKVSHQRGWDTCVPTPHHHHQRHVSQPR